MQLGTSPARARRGAPAVHTGASREGAPPFSAPPRATARPGSPRPSTLTRLGAAGGWTPRKRLSGMEPTAQHTRAWNQQTSIVNRGRSLLLTLSKAPQIWKTQ